MCIRDSRYILGQSSLFDETTKEKKVRKEKLKELELGISKLSSEIQEIKSNKIYENAFEWRFEFPEVLNDDGEYEGFDVLIGNPPYGVSIKDLERTHLIESVGKVPDFEIYYLFINRSNQILRKSGFVSLIIPNSIIFNVYAKTYRINLFDSWEINEVLDCTDFDIFADATVRNVILSLKKMCIRDRLLTYHKSDATYSFLNQAKITNFDDLNSLFFQVLARKSSDRNNDAKKLFAKVPYLNSSLFEPTDIEHTALFISNLRDDKKIPVLSSTVLKDSNGNKFRGELSTLEYLFKFLDAYDFASEGAEEIQEENKSLINASVLGLIFEKINGYKDGSFFTPGFITMYMSRETIRRAVVQKFNEVKGWKCATIAEVYEQRGTSIKERKEANAIINSIKICDSAVGSCLLYTSRCV